MASRDIESLVLQMSVDLRRYEKSMDRMAIVSQKRLTQVESQALKSQKNLERIMGQAGDGMVRSLGSSLRELAPTLAAAFSVQQVVKYADAWTSGRNALAAAGVATEDLGRRQGELVDLANETRSSTEQTIALYRRLTIATDEMGLAQSDALRLTELLNKSFQTSGSSTQEAASSALQLSQALASGVLQGDELRSIRENAPQIAQAIAKAMGVGIGELKKLGAEGKITAQVVASAILGAGDQIEARFATTTATVSQSLTIMDNQLGRYIGQSDAGLSATQRAAQGVIGLANNLDTIIPVVGTLAALVGGRYAIAMATAGVQTGIATVNSVAYQAALIRLQARQVGATGAQIALNAAMSANPIGFVVTAVAALAAGLFFLSAKYGEANVMQREQKAVTERASTAIDAYREAAVKAATATGQNAAAARANAEAMRLEALQAVRSAQALQQRRQALLQQRVAEAQQEAADIRTSVGPGQTTLNQGQYAAARSEVAIAQRALDQAKAEATSALGQLSALEQDIKNGRLAPVAAPPAAAKDDKAKKETGPTPADLAAQREMLALQGRVELLRAQGREAEAASAQRQIDILNLTKTLKDAGVADAQKAATEQVNALASAEAASRGREAAVERTRTLLDMAAEAQARNAGLAEDELGFRAEIARLLGDEAGVLAAERELDIVRRVADLRAKGVSGPDAEKQAPGEVDKLRGAAIVGGLGSGFNDPAEQQRALYEEIERLRQADVLSEQQAAAAKAQADVAYQEQRLANAVTFFSTLAQLQNSSNKELAAIGKAAAIAQATIDGYVAVQKALASAPPPFNYALAAAVGVVAAANVAQIAGLKDGGPVGGSGGPRQDNQLRWLSTGEYVVNAKATAKHRALLEAINAGGIPKLANGGPVGLPPMPNLSGMGGRSPSMSFAYSPTIDARGADAGVEARLRALMADEQRSFNSRAVAALAKRDRYRLGRNRDD